MSGHTAWREVKEHRSYTAADVLRRAADLIESKGLAKGQPRGEDGEICPLYAISYASAQLAIEQKTMAGVRHNQTIMAAEKLTTYLDKHSPRSDRMGIVAWSDHPDTTKEEVVAAMRAAAA